MNVLLIYPEFPDTFWSFKYALPFVGKRSTLPPLGLLTVAAMLPAEWTVRLVDTNVRKLTDKDLAWADWAFISAMVIQRESSRRVVDRCKDAGLRVVAGEPLFLNEHELFPTVDHFILNEAELTLPPFLQDLAQGQPRRIDTSELFADLQQTPIPRWGLLQAPPGTRLYERMKKEGRLDCAASGDNADGTTNIIPTMSLKALKDGYQNILNNIYSPAPYYRRVKTFLREYKPTHVPYRLRFCHIRALFRSFYLLGIVGRERFQYWKLILWTQFRHPRLVPQTIMLAIYGYHFRKICEKQLPASALQRAT